MSLSTPLQAGLILSNSVLPRPRLRRLLIHRLSGKLIEDIKKCGTAIIRNVVSEEQVRTLLLHVGSI